MSPVRGCGTSRAIDLRTVDRHPLASVVGMTQFVEAEIARRKKEGAPNN
jgi:hypothetical protein